MKKQDWTPRQYDWTPQEAILHLSGHEWWDYMHQVRHELGEDRFHQWVLRMARPWYRRMKFVDMMAWNDRNSAFNLDHEVIRRMHRFSDNGEKVTAGIIAQSMESMLG